MNNPIVITALREGAQGIISSIKGGGALTSRLAGMGIVTNAKFRIAQISGGLIVIQVADTRIALGRGEAARIMVYKTTDEVCLPPVDKEIYVEW